MLYEQLSSENRAYNKREQTIFVLNALTFDKRFKEGLTYVESTIQDYQRDSRVSSLTPFPLDLEIDEIAVTIDERSDEYVVGDNITTTKVINPYAKLHIRMLEATDLASIRTMGSRNYPRTDAYKKDSTRNAMINLRVETRKCARRAWVWAIASPTQTLYAII